MQAFSDPYTCISLKHSFNLEVPVNMTNKIEKFCDNIFIIACRDVMF